MVSSRDSMVLVRDDEIVNDLEELALVGKVWRYLRAVTVTLTVEDEGGRGEPIEVEIK